MKKILLALGIVSAMSLTGCASVGTNFEMSCADKLQPGVSTREDAVAACGKYRTEAENDKGEIILGWSYGHAVGFSAHGKALLLAFDKEGKFLRIAEKSEI